MAMRSLFFSPKNKKTNLDLSIRWNEPLTEKRIQQLENIHVLSLLDAYKDHKNEQLKVTVGMTRETWLRNGINRVDIPGLKEGSYVYAGIFLNNEFVGFVICKSNPPTEQNDFKNKIYISLLAVKPYKYSFANSPSSKATSITYPEWLTNKIDSGELPENIRIGLGKLLIEAVMKRFPHANLLTLDTRATNVNARQFYEHLGFKCIDTMEEATFVDYEKPIMRRFSA